MELKDISKKIDKYDNLAQKNFMNYQESGEPRYLSSSEKYEELADVYRMAYKYKDEEDTNRTRRMKNISAFIENHIEENPKETYSKAEVIELAKRIKEVAF